MRDSGTAVTFLVDLGPLIFLLSVLLSAGLLALLRPLLLRYALVRPNSRSSHKAPTPQGGGMAVLTALLFVVAGTLILSSGISVSEIRELIFVLGAACMLAVAGALDDIWDLNATTRLIIQGMAICALIAVFPSEFQLVPFLPWWVDRLLTLLAGVWFVNLVNFMDGIDLMTVSEVVPMAIGFILLGIMGALPLHGLLVALALSGSLIGFAPFNWPAAKIFLGDVGSLPIGAILGWLLLLVVANGHFAAALLLPMYYVADATITLLLRLKRREPIWLAHRTHFYQRAMDRGFSVLEIVGRVFAVNIVLIILALLTIWSSSLVFDVAAVGTGALLVGWLLSTFGKKARRHE